MTGAAMQESVKTLGELKGIFRDESAWSVINPNQEVYRVRWWPTVSAADEGGLFWGGRFFNLAKLARSAS